jgi:predicted phage terminase large subunit-like protein
MSKKTKKIPRETAESEATDSLSQEDIRLKIAEAVLQLPADLRRYVANIAADALGAHSLKEHQDTILPFREFIRQAWFLVEPETPFVDSFCVDAIAEHLEAVARGDIRRLVICIPRRMGKSLICSVLFPAWAFSIDPSIRLICASYSLAFVKRDAIKTRDVIRSHWYRQRYGSRVDIRVDQEQVHWFYTTRGGFRLATSPGGIGIGEGADIQIVDDPHKPQDINSPVKRQFVIDWWESTMSGSARNPHTLRRVVVQQRLHPADLAGVCIAKGYDALILPMEYDGIRRSTSLGEYDPRKNRGELLWPERFGEAEVQVLKRELGPRGYSAQCQQQPTGDEDRLFRDENWVFWSDAIDAPIMMEVPILGTCTVVPKPKTFDRVVMSWDIAVSGNYSSNWSVGQVWGEYNSTFYLLDQVRFRGGYTVFIEKFKEFSERHPECYAKLVEESAVSATIIDILKSSFDGIVPVPPSGDKALRAEVASGLHREHRLVVPLPDDYPWVNDLIVEFSEFNQDGGYKYDDQVDACSQAIMYMRRHPPLAFV